MPPTAQVMYLGRINMYNSSVTRVDKMNIRSLDSFIRSKAECIKPIQCLDFMHTVLSHMHDLLPGGYVLVHAAGDSTVRIMRQCKPKDKLQTAHYDLHEALDTAGEIDNRVSGPVPAGSTWGPLFRSVLRGGG